MSGSLEVILGPMFSGKSTELIRELNRSLIAKQDVVLFKPAIDNRYSETKVVSHDGRELEAFVVNSLDDILVHSANATVVGVDEIQFFSIEIASILNGLANSGKRVIAAGLSTDFMGDIFQTSALVSAYADKVEKLTAICLLCGDEACWSQMISNGDPVTAGDRIQVGGIESYEPRCRDCFVSATKEALV